MGASREWRLPLIAFDRRRAEVSSMFTPSFPACSPAWSGWHFMPWPRCVSSVVYSLACPPQPTLQRSLQMHIRYTADRFRLIARIENEPAASSKLQGDTCAVLFFCIRFAHGIMKPAHSQNFTITMQLPMSR